MSDSCDLQVRSHVVPSQPIAACQSLIQRWGMESDVYTDRQAHIHVDIQTHQ